MNDHEIFINLIKNNISEMLETIDSLYISCNSCTKNMLLNRLRRSVTNLSMLVQGFESSQHLSDANDPQQNPTRVFTLAELRKYNGRNGNPAYVAVNGTVYDVTNNAAWAAATHFGLTSGRDLTGEFASCHSGQSALSRLKAVGTIAE